MPIVTLSQVPEREIASEDTGFSPLQFVDLVVGTAVVAIVYRKRHTILWTVFGLIPLGFAAVNFIKKGKI